MITYIDGEIGAGRKLTFAKENVYIGEKNSAVIRVTAPGPAEVDPDFYLFSFEIAPGRGCTVRCPSDDGQAYIDSDGRLCCRLGTAMTAGRTLAVQISAYYSGGEIIEKTGVGYICFGYSICTHADLPDKGAEIYTEIEKLKRRIEAVERNDYEFDMNYLACSIAARMLFVNSARTPVYFPETADEAAELMRTLENEFDAGRTDIVMVIRPPEGGNEAALGIITRRGGNLLVGYYKGRGLLNLLVREVTNE